MNTRITQDQITSIISQYFEDRGSGIRFMMYDVAEDGSFAGGVINHDLDIELPVGE